MPRGIREDSVEGADANTEQMVFRVSRTMRAQILSVSRFENYTSYGEYFRALHRAHASEVLNSAAYKTHLRLKAEEEEMKRKREEDEKQGRLK